MAFIIEGKCRLKPKGPKSALLSRFKRVKFQVCKRKLTLNFINSALGLRKPNFKTKNIHFEHKTSGLKSKHLNTRPRTPELCDWLKRELSREKKHPQFPITLAYRKCNHVKQYNSVRNKLNLYL